MYTSCFTHNPDKLEIYRYFRSTKYQHIDQFYNNFFSFTKTYFPELFFQAEKNFNKDYLKGFDYYSFNDKWFRFLRDKILGKHNYDFLMDLIMKENNFNFKMIIDSLWMKKKHLLDLENNGNLIGLHSHTHPTTMGTLTRENQKKEYITNFNYLKEILKNKPISMSHPCGNYNLETLKILSDLKIKIGFRSNVNIPNIKSNLEIPRVDHANLIKSLEL